MSPSPHAPYFPQPRVPGQGIPSFTQQSKLAKMCPLYLRPLMAATGTLAGGSSRAASPTTEDALPCPS